MNFYRPYIPISEIGMYGGASAGAWASGWNPVTGKQIHEQ
jgi:hypothetical protein